MSEPEYRFTESELRLFLKEVIEESLEGMINAIVNPVNYRATVAYSLMDVMHKFMYRESAKYNDYINGLLLEQESRPAEVEKVYEWLQKAKHGADDTVRRPPGSDDSREV